ncbi:uncharacterized protein PITG_12200 [Phytophthora infestans T30-4]|uniref:Uncharacterized protein n=1 Tax=Phytophthora infestans (strain T30-4) TaxID=403677 RepID=D0NJA4_PHYIT|nr:uncharacterized protein PITG_12200 [Phytophthora infestans T30-4]EEY59622.1 hypothetical protein PITG_12200 [Phytophthora infestans T30-4]|eukprot:XP_002900815.1 hypothetical protein PITG_12200 [Phytophthora infestans T30-4]
MSPPMEHSMESFPLFIRPVPCRLARANLLGEGTKSNSGRIVTWTATEEDLLSGRGLLSLVDVKESS